MIVAYLGIDGVVLEFACSICYVYMVQSLRSLPPWHMTEKSPLEELDLPGTSDGCLLFEEGRARVNIVCRVQAESWQSSFMLALLSTVFASSVKGLSYECDAWGTVFGLFALSNRMQRWSQHVNVSGESS